MADAPAVFVATIGDVPSFALGLGLLFAVFGAVHIVATTESLPRWFAILRAALAGWPL
jgi:hypothetical protein